MERHKVGIDRNQISMELLDFESIVAADNPVRDIDAMVNRLDAKQLGFAYCETKGTSRKPYAMTNI